MLVFDKRIMLGDGSYLDSCVRACRLQALQRRARVSNFHVLSKKLNFAIQNGLWVPESTGKLDDLGVIKGG